MPMPNRLPVTILTLLLLSVLPTRQQAAGPEGQTSPERYGFFPGSFGNGEYTADWKSTWPVQSFEVRTNKVALGLSGSTRFPTPFVDPFLDDRAGWFEFPQGSRTNYLQSIRLSFGGIVGNDTLVSESLPADRHVGAELFPPGDPSTMHSLLPIDVGCGSAFRTSVVDTFTWPAYRFLWIGWDRFHGDHIPLNIELVQKTYTYNVGVWQNIVLVDYTVTNIGAETISEAWFAVEANPTVYGELAPRLPEGPDDDDLIGSLRDIGTMYMIDNDGDPLNGYFQEGISPTAGLGLRPVMMHPPPTDTNFNWWWYDSWLGVDWGPRHKDRPDDPFRDFQTDGLGIPDGDINLYYTMRHPEWDYDQYLTATIEANDTLWMAPYADSIAVDLANGENGTALMSLGPFDLLPDSSARVVLALFGGDFVHLDPRNGRNLSLRQYNTYRDNLNLSILRERAADAVTMVQEVVSPQSRPTGFTVTFYSGDTVRFSWDPFVFPNVDGYRLYLTPVDDSFFVDGRNVEPGAAPVEPVPHAFIPVGRRSTEITGLEPGQVYFAQLAHTSQGSDGDLSPAVVVGYGNRSLTPQTVEPLQQYSFFDEGAESVVISWRPSDDTLVDFYRIYRTTDSATSALRHEPFFAIDSSITWYTPSLGDERDGTPWFYYRMQPYDSVPAPQNAFVDRRLSSDAHYWITAVNRYGMESAFSRRIRTQVSVPPTRDVLVILGTTWSVHDWVETDSLFAYYDRLLAGYDYDLYSWPDTNQDVHLTRMIYDVNWADLARYRLIVVEELPYSAIATDLAESPYHTLTKIINSGRDLVYFGTPAGANNLLLNYETDLTRFDSTSFVSRLLGIDSMAMRTWSGSYETYGVLDSLAGFNAAIPIEQGLPPLAFDGAADRTNEFIENLFSRGGYLPLTPAFFPGEQAEIIYTYGSAFPESSELAGLPVGIRVSHTNANVYVCGFHLWAMDMSDARNLINYVLNHQTPDTALTPYFLPQSTILHQNFPNPFNPSTTIRFEVPARNHVTLEVFDILGRKTTTLLDRTCPPGPHELVWNGRTSSGGRAASGVYFYRLRSGRETFARKMLLLK